MDTNEQPVASSNATSPQSTTLINAAWQFETGPAPAKRPLFAFRTRLCTRIMSSQPERTPISSARNLGPKSAALLVESGIPTLEDLKRSGPIVAYLSVRQRHPEVTLNLLWSLYGAIHNKDWRELSESTKQRLIQEINA